MSGRFPLSFVPSTRNFFWFKRRSRDVPPYRFVLLVYWIVNAFGYENYVRLRACFVLRHWPVKNAMTFFHVRSRVRDAKWNAGAAINRQRRVVDSHFSGLPLETCAVLVYNPKLEWRSKPIPKSGWKNRGKERSVNERSTGYEIKPRCVQNQNKHIYELSMAITHARFE